MNPGRLLRDLAAAELVELLGIRDITASLGEAHRKLDALHALAVRILEVQMTTDRTTQDLLDDVATLTAADNELATQFTRFEGDFQALKDQVANLPTDRPLNAVEQQALNDAVAAIEDRTAAIKARTAAVITVDPAAPVINGDGGTGQGSVVTVPQPDPTPADAPTPDPADAPPVIEPAPPVTTPVTESPATPTDPGTDPTTPAAGDGTVPQA